MFIISNHILSVQVSPIGAELQSIYHEENKLEYLWSGDPAYWAKKSPVLFPIVGELKNATYTYNGNEYTLSRHGFAREMEFELAEKTEDSITLFITWNQETLAVYPFEFKFSVKYTLIENLVEVSYIVENNGNETMYFSVGAHPAFKVPIDEETSFNDYDLVFSENETAERWPVTSEGLISTVPVVFLENQHKLPLRKELFAGDALVFKNLRSSAISIQSPKAEHSVKVAFEGFPYLGIWSAKGADFVCIEPWIGLADSVNASGNLTEKEGIKALAPAAIFVATYTIQLF